MTTTIELAELAHTIRRVLPTPRHLTRLEPNEAAGFVELTWHSRSFAVTPKLDVVELKGRTLMCTGASVLLQAILRTREKNNRIATAIIESIRTAEDSMRFDQERGLALLEDVKETLLSLAGQPVSTGPKALTPVRAP